MSILGSALRVRGFCALRRRRRRRFAACASTAAPVDRAELDLPPGSIPGAIPTSSDSDPAALVAADRPAGGGPAARQRRRSRSCRTRTTGSRTQLRRFREDVEFRLGAAAAAGGRRGAGARRVAAAGRRRAARPRKNDAFDPNADPNAPGAPRPLGSTPPSAPLTGPLSVRARRRARRWISSRARPAPPPGRRSRPDAEPPTSSPAASTSPTGRASSSTRRSTPTRPGNTPTRRSS